MAFWRTGCTFYTPLQLSAKVGTAPPSLVDQTLLVLANQESVHDNADTHVAVSGATLINTADSTMFTLQLTEAQKVTLQLFSATAGGDGTGNVFTPSNCSNNIAYNSQQSLCEADSEPGVGVFTQNRCDCRTFRRHGSLHENTVYPKNFNGGRGECISRSTT